MLNPKLRLFTLALLLSLSGCSDDATQEPASLVDPAKTLYAVGHAYGAVGSDNLAVEPRLVSYLKENPIDDASGLVFLGDFLKGCSEDRWVELKKQLQQFSFKKYLVRGNHEGKDNCAKHFNELYGKTYYSFTRAEVPFLALDVSDSKRIVSPDQIAYLKEFLNEHRTRKYIIILNHFFLWNSDEKRYGHVNSNNGSKSDRMQESNYWQAIHPELVKYKDVQFYLLAGDTGARPNTVASFYDKVDNVSFIGTGMGAIDDEEILLMELLEDAPVFKHLRLDGK
jgi:hypothetical protein